MGEYLLGQMGVFQISECAVGHCAQVCLLFFSNLPTLILRQVTITPYWPTYIWPKHLQPQLKGIVTMHILQLWLKPQQLCISLKHWRLWSCWANQSASPFMVDAKKLVASSTFPLSTAQPSLPFAQLSRIWTIRRALLACVPSGNSTWTRYRKEASRAIVWGLTQAVDWTVGLLLCWYCWSQAHRCGTAWTAEAWCPLKSGVLTLRVYVGARPFEREIAVFAAPRPSVLVDTSG